MWEKFDLNVKLSILSGETFVAVEVLLENEDFIKKIQAGMCQADCLDWISKNF
jgi:hypothetical protein